MSKMFQYVSLFFVISLFKVNGIKLLLNDRHKFEDISSLLPEYYSGLSMDKDVDTEGYSKFIEIFKLFELKTVLKEEAGLNYSEEDFIKTEYYNTISDNVNSITSKEDAENFITLLKKVVLPGTWTYYAFNHNTLFNSVVKILNDLSIRTDSVDIFKSTLIFKLYENLKSKESISKSDIENKSFPTLVENIFETEILESDQFGFSFEESICSKFTSRDFDDLVSDFQKYISEILKVTKYSRKENSLRNRVFDKFYPNHPDFSFLVKFESSRSDEYAFDEAICSTYANLSFDFDSKFTTSVQRVFLDGPFTCRPTGSIRTIYPNPEIELKSEKDADLSLNCVFGKLLALRKMMLRVNEIFKTFKEEFNAYNWRFDFFENKIELIQKQLGEKLFPKIDKYTTTTTTMSTTTTTTLSPEEKRRRGCCIV